MFENMRLATLFDMFLNPSFEMTASFVKIIDCCQQHRLSIIFACLVSAIVCFSKFSFCISWPEVTKEQLTITWNFIQIKKFNTSLDSLHRFPLSLRWSVWLLRNTGTCACTLKCIENLWSYFWTDVLLCDSCYLI